MKSLKQLRIEKGLYLKDIELSLGIGQPNLSQIENGKQCPDLLTRHRLEQYFGERINWLDTPNINTTARNPTNWNSAEREFRSFIRSVSGLPKDERTVFLSSIIKHLRRKLKA